MHIGYTAASGRGATDLLLAQVAERARAAGLTCIGAVQHNSMPADGQLCDMDVRVLPDGPVIRISETRGPGARGCRLDPAALEAAVAATERALAEGGADLLIVNKFGKHEAAGRGFRPVIAEALGRDVPVLVGLGALNAPDFLDFAGPAAQALAPEPEAILDWIGRVCRPAASGAA